MVYDPASAKVILFGGQWTPRGAKDNTWAYDPAACSWTKLDPTGTVPSAPRLSSHGLRRRRSVGCSCSEGLQTFSIPAPTSTTPGPTTLPPIPGRSSSPPAALPSARVAHAMVYDPGTDKVILFGGARTPITSTSVNDTWAYDPAANTWTELKPAGSVPSARNGHSHGLRSGHWPDDSLWRVGGTGESYDDTWAYDPAANTWTELPPAGSGPSCACRKLRGVRSSKRQDVSLWRHHGGSGRSNERLSQRYLGLRSWPPTAGRSSSLPAACLPRGSAAAMVYDPDGKRMILSLGNAGRRRTSTIPGPTTLPPTPGPSSSRPAQQARRSVASSTTTTTVPATKTELDVMMVEEPQPGPRQDLLHASCATRTGRRPTRTTSPGRQTTIEAATERAAGMKAPAGSEDAYKHLAAFLEAETKVIEEMKTNVNSKAPKILGEAGTKLLRQATVELGSAREPRVRAGDRVHRRPCRRARTPGSTEVSGKWNWVVNEMGQEDAGPAALPYIGYRR